jgi:hypothetical protein
MKVVVIGSTGPGGHAKYCGTFTDALAGGGEGGGGGGGGAF